MDAGLIIAGGVICWYLLHCLLYPYKPCPVCGRGGEIKSESFVHAFGTCRWCKGKGCRVRTGARLMGIRS